MEKDSENAVKRSEQSTLCNSGTTFLKANTSLRPAQTAWANSNMRSKNFVNENYYYLLFKEGFQKTETLNSYFIASRAVDLTDTCFNFGIFEVSVGGGIKTVPLFNSRGASFEYWDRIRPIVEIPLENIKIDMNCKGSSPETALKLMKK